MKGAGKKIRRECLGQKKRYKTALGGKKDIPFILRRGPS